MKHFLLGFLAFVLLSFPAVLSAETAGGWVKCPQNPVLGGDLGVCFDIAMLKQGEIYKMWFSWRTKKSIAYTESRDGISWSAPRVVLTPAGGWEGIVNRPGVLFKDGKYHLWYTGQADGRSRIGNAVSDDGLSWKRVQSEPVLVSEQPWEDVAVMCPHVLWDDAAKIFKMWYSGGEQNEPNALGFATSPDGITWKKLANNPIFRPDPNLPWEKHKVTAAQILPCENGYLMFYIGFASEERAQIGAARSTDGQSGWERLAANPIISPDADRWDGDACYKPFAIFNTDKDRWELWYNGRRGGIEQIGMAIHPGKELGFPTPHPTPTSEKLPRPTTPF